MPGQATWMFADLDIALFWGWGGGKKEGGHIAQEFWDNMWKWKYNETTGAHVWDQCLEELALLVGVKTTKSVIPTLFSHFLNKIMPVPETKLV